MSAARGARAREPRWGTVFLEGLLYIVAGAVAVLWPGSTALAFVWVIGFWAIFSGGLEIASAIRLRKWIEHEWILGLAGAVSVLFGWSCCSVRSRAVAVVWWLGAYAVVFGTLHGHARVPAASIRPYAWRAAATCQRKGCISRPEPPVALASGAARGAGRPARVVTSTEARESLAVDPGRRLRGAHGCRGRGPAGTARRDLPQVYAQPATPVGGAPRVRDRQRARGHRSHGHATDRRRRPQPRVPRARPPPPRAPRRTRWSSAAPICSTAILAPGAFALIHAALVFEHVEPARLVARIARWLAPGGICAAVLEVTPADRAAARPVSPTDFAGLQTLSGTMRLVAPDELRRLFAPHGLAELRAWEVPLRRRQGVPRRPLRRIDHPRFI